VIVTRSTSLADSDATYNRPGRISPGFRRGTVATSTISTETLTEGGSVFGVRSLRPGASGLKVVLNGPDSGSRHCEA
jgi:hypothetical protein